MATEADKLKPPSPRLATPVERKRRSYRRKAEDVPSMRYVEQMEKLGPRTGESLLAYTKRMAAVQAARTLWFKVWVECAGDKGPCSIAAGIPRNNLAYELRLVGLSADLLDVFVRSEARKKGK